MVLYAQGFLKSQEYLAGNVINWSGTVALQKLKTDKTLRNRSTIHH